MAETTTTSTPTKQTAVAPPPVKQMTPTDEVKNSLMKLEPQFKTALPTHITTERFMRVLLTGVQQSPDIIAADRQSLYAAAMRSAQDGLLPDGREAALVVFNRNVGTREAPKWLKVVQYMPMVAGILKKVRNSGELASITAHVVREKDTFNYQMGDNEEITHSVPPIGQDRGKPIGAYAIATLRDGTKVRQVMTLQEIEKRKEASRSKASGPWVSWWDEMAEKTVIRRLSNRLPMSTDLENVIRADDEDLIDEPELEKEPAKPTSTRLSAIVGATQAKIPGAVEAEIVASERDGGEELPI